MKARNIGGVKRLTMIMSIHDQYQEQIGEIDIQSFCIENCY
jgi:hypothetical protein